MGRKAGPKIILNEKKLKILFPAMMIAPQIKYIAYQLGISTDTVKNYIANGETLMENYKKELEPLEDVFSFEYETVFENRKLEFDAQFRQMYEIEPEDKIPDRLRLEYSNFILREKNKFIEANVYRREKELLENIKLDDNEDLDYMYKVYIKFARIYNRAKCVKELGYIQNIDKHAGTSKNVGLSLKMLEKMNKEDFGETQTIQHSGNIEVSSKNILSIAMQLEKQEKINSLPLEKKENIIDVTPINLLEKKEG